MGYCVDFVGRFNLNTPLTAEHAATMRGYEDSEEWPGKVPDRFFNPWLITDDNAGFEVRTDKPHDWKPWLQYTIDEWLVPHGYTLSGRVEWDGEESGDCGVITIEDGKVKARRKVATKWSEVSEDVRRHIGRATKGAKNSDGRNDGGIVEQGWQSALDLLGFTKQSDRTVFDD